MLKRHFINVRMIITVERYTICMDRARCVSRCVALYCLVFYMLVCSVYVNPIRWSCKKNCLLLLFILYVYGSRRERDDWILAKPCVTSRFSGNEICLRRESSLPLIYETL